MNAIVPHAKQVIVIIVPAKAVHVQIVIANQKIAPLNLEEHLFMETLNIYNKYSGSVKRFILSKIQNETVTDDLVQEVFIRVHLHKSDLREKKLIKSWIFSITSNLVNDYFQRIFKLSEIDEIPNYEEVSPEEHSPSHCVRPLIEQLPKKYKEALFLSEIKGKKQAEVANILQISLSGAKSRIQRGRKLLQKGFVKCCDYKISEDGFLTGEHKPLEECKVCS